MLTIYTSYRYTDPHPMFGTFDSYKPSVPGSSAQWQPSPWASAAQPVVPALCARLKTWEQEAPVLYMGVIPIIQKTTWEWLNKFSYLCLGGVILLMVSVYKHIPMSV